MAKPTVLIVDDEPLARAKIRRLLAASDLELELSEAVNGLAAVAAIRAAPPDVVLLDVDMPGLNGLEVLAQLQERRFQVIFQTAHDDYAIKAFEANACDYLLKPFTAERLVAALRKALSGIAVAARLAELERALLPRQEHLQKLAIRVGDELVVVMVEQVLCFTSRDHYTCLHMLGGEGTRELLTELSLDHLEERLDPALFQRIHRNALVRVTAITGLRRGEPAVAVLSNGLEVPVARRRVAALKERFGG